MSIRAYATDLRLKAWEMAALGAKTLTYSHLVGYERYLSGEADTFRGVRLVNDKQFELHIEGEFLPYFYELMYANVTPYPKVIISTTGLRRAKASRTGSRRISISSRRAKAKIRPNEAARPE